MTATEGVTIEKDEQGRVRRVTVDAILRPDLVEDILDELLAERAENDERHDWAEVWWELLGFHGRSVGHGKD